jgi:hypothetical protein
MAFIREHQALTVAEFLQHRTNTRAVREGAHGQCSRISQDVFRHDAYGKIYVTVSYPFIFGMSETVCFITRWLRDSLPRCLEWMLTGCSDEVRTFRSSYPFDAELPSLDGLDGPVPRLAGYLPAFYPFNCWSHR